MELKEIKELIRFVSKAGVREVELEKDDFKIVIKTGETSEGEPKTVYTQMMPPNMAPHQIVPGQPQPAPASTGESQGKPQAEDEGKTNYVEIKAPMIGTFYRASGPDKDVFVKVGDTVDQGQVVCIIEAMKLFNEIESEVSGKIVKVLAEDASPVEYDQPLFLVDPS